MQRRFLIPAAAIVLGATTVCTDSASMGCGHDISDNALTVMIGFSGIFNHLGYLTEVYIQQEFKYSRQRITEESYRQSVTKLLMQMSQRYASASNPSGYVVVDKAQLNFASMEGHLMLNDLIVSLKEMSIEDLTTINSADVQEFCDDYQILHFSLRAYCISICTFMFSQSLQRQPLLNLISEPLKDDVPPYCDFQLAATEFFPT